MADDVYEYINNTGVIIVDTNIIQTEVQQEYLNTFGSDLNLDPSTPQGMLITIETSSRVAVADNNATLANQINPNISGGVFLDALLQLTGAQRIPSAPSIVDCTLTGVASTFIPSGSQISTTDGLTVFQLVSNTTIPAGGSIENIQFKSVQNGQIVANANTLTVIVSNILGWETVNNPNQAIIGSLTQNDAQARLQRQNTLGLQGNSIANNVISNLYNLDGVPPSGVTFQENYFSTTETINEIVMVPHSLYTCVGGSASNIDIATTIQNSKSGGCAYNNGLGIPISQIVIDQFSGQAITVLFDKPSIVTIEMIITVHANTTVQNVVTAVQNAIIAYSLGQLEGQPGFAVGQAVSPFQISAAIISQVPGLFIQDIEIGVLSITQQGTLTSGMNTVTNLTYNQPIDTFVGIEIGMIVSDGNVNIPASTTVVSRIGSNEITMSANATGSDTEILTFTTAPSFQTTEIPIGVWQQAVTFSSLITVLQV